MGVTHTVERKCWSAQRQTLTSGAGTHWDRGSYYLMWHSVHEIAHTFKFLITKEPEKHFRDQQNSKTNGQSKGGREEEEEGEAATQCLEPSANLDFLRNNEVSGQ